MQTSPRMLLYAFAAIIARDGASAFLSVPCLSLRGPPTVALASTSRSMALSSVTTAPPAQEQLVTPEAALLAPKAVHNHEPETCPRILWTFWDKGEEHLPKFLRICLQSWRHRCPDWKVVVLSPSNLLQYLELGTDLPSSFFDIDRASLQSDVARVAILARYGGVYTDISTLAMSNVAEQVRNTLNGGASLYSYHNFGWIHDFVAAWFMGCKPREPVMVEWNRALNLILEGRVNDHDIHLHPFLRDVDLSDYFGPRSVGPNHPSKCWADYLIVNVALRAVLQRNPRLSERFWRTAALIDHGHGNRKSPTRMFDHPGEVGIIADPEMLKNLTSWPDQPVYVSAQLLQAQHPKVMCAVATAPFVKFFQASKVSSALKGTGTGGLEDSSGIRQLIDFAFETDMYLPEDQSWVLSEEAKRRTLKAKASNMMRRLLPSPGSLLSNPFSPWKRPFNRLRLWAAAAVRARRSQCLP
jgi:hypothetical protein